MALRSAALFFLAASFGERSIQEVVTKLPTTLLHTTVGVCRFLIDGPMEQRLGVNYEQLVGPDV